MGTWTRVVRATLVAHSGESAATAAMRVLTRCMSVTIGSWAWAASIRAKVAAAERTVAVLLLPVVIPKPDVAAAT